MKKLPQLVWKLLPLIVVGALLAILAASTGMVTAKLKVGFLSQLKETFVQVTPILVNLCIAFLVVYSATLVYNPIRCGVEKCLNSSSVNFSPRGRRFWTLALQASFWIVVGLVAVRIVAPGLADSALLSSSIVVGGMALAAQDAVKNYIASVSLHSMPKCHEGDYVKVVGSEGAEGVIEKIDYLMTTINVKGEGKRKIVLPNSVVWNNSVIIGKPEKESEKKTEPTVVVVQCHGNGQCPSSAHSACGCGQNAPATELATATADGVKDLGPRSAQADAHEETEHGPRPAQADSHDVRPAQGDK